MIGRNHTYILANKTVSPDATEIQFRQMNRINWTLKPTPELDWLDQNGIVINPNPLQIF